MSDYNHVGISGRLTRDAELKQLPSGTTLAEFGLASNRKYGDSEETTFVDVTVWGKQAEALSQYLVKGKHVIVSGRLRLESWEKDGQKRSKLSINADTVDFSPGGSKAEAKESLTEEVEENVPF